MKLTFYKFHGAGNDFIMIDNRTGKIVLSSEQVKFLCHRRFGVGADGLIILGKKISEHTDFNMQYYNADGREASLCGNGSRCVVAFAHFLEMIDGQTQFTAFDGIHSAKIIHYQSPTWQISLSMNDLSDMISYSDGLFLDTGSPHFVVFCEDAHLVDVQSKGKELRHDSRFSQGSNIDFCSPYQDGIFVRTYERGVEDETLSCGTGVTATAIAWAKKHHFKNGEYFFKIYTLGGEFMVSFTINEESFYAIKLKGPATFSFKGEIQLL